ncbi:MAG TPA: hypothetical protein VFO24_00660, partial [Usitatibacter sp.]|nr:hypothetical protein [Usitatibacter sp.]
LSGEDLAAIARRWARNEWIYEGERRWSPHQAQLTILAGPPLTVGQLAMGRGWRNAERSGRDVTDRVLKASKAGEAVPAAPVASRAAGSEGERMPTGDTSEVIAAHGATREFALLADSVALELLALLDRKPAPLSDAYALARARLHDGGASKCLALAELAVRSLRARGLVEIVREGGDAETERAPAARARALGESEVEGALRALESWVDCVPSERVSVRRA